MRKTVRLAIALVLASVVLGLAAAPALACDGCPPPPCTSECRSPGFWKNHPEDWPVEGLTIGGVYYTKAEAIAYMQQEPGDKTYTLFRALVAARLNVLAGCGNSVSYTLGASNTWFINNPLGSGVDGSSSAWACGEPLYHCLDAFNNPVE